MLMGMGLPAVDWLGSSDLALSTLVAIDIWQQTSFVVLLLSAGLASLPKDPYEAAKVDGASAFQQFWYITLPLLRPISAIAIIIQLINEFRTYDLIYVLTKGGRASRRSCCRSSPTSARFRAVAQPKATPPPSSCC